MGEKQPEVIKHLHAVEIDIGGAELLFDILDYDGQEIWRIEARDALPGQSVTQHGALSRQWVWR